MKKYAFFWLLFISIFSFGQKSKKTPAQKLPANTQVWIIDAQRAKCEGVTTQNCLLVKKPGDKDFNLFYETIAGFEYEDGFVYTIWVKEEMKTPPIPVDVSVYNYVLVKVVSKKPLAGYSNTTTENKKPESDINAPSTKTLIINEEKTACEGNPDAKCLLIKQSNSYLLSLCQKSSQYFVIKLPSFISFHLSKEFISFYL